MNSGDLQNFFQTENGMVNWAIEQLHRRGFTIKEPSTKYSWETPREFASRIGMHIGSVKRTVLKAQAAGLFIEVAYHTGPGKGKRIRVLRSTDAFEAFIVAKRARAGFFPSTGDQQ